LVLIFDFINGFHDSANSIATVVSTKVLSPLAAVSMAAFFNFIAFVIFPLSVATTIGNGVIEPDIINLNVIGAALIAAITWNLLTWWWSLPSSSSHTLVGGLVGAALVSSGPDSVITSGVIKIVAFIVISPLLGMIFGFILSNIIQYFARNHTPRKTLEERFIKSISETIDMGGRAIIPAFGIGRTQEIMLILKKHGLPAFVDGMGVDVFNLFKRSPEYVKDINKLEKAFTSANIVKREDRESIINKPSIIVTSAGMLNGGPVLYYIDEIYNDPKSKIFLTGYQADDTNGRSALTRGYIVNGKRTVHLNCRLELYDFSAHCGDVQLKEVVKKFCDNGTETVIAVHGDNTEGFANWIREEMGVTSFAPANQEKISI